MSLIKILQEKIDALHYKEKMIKKTFKFTSENLKNNPNGCFNEIVKYLEKNSENIVDFEIDHWIDSEDFSNVLSINILPTDGIKNEIPPLYDIFHISSRNAILDSMRENIQNVLSSHEWNFEESENREIIRKSLIKCLGVNIEDHTKKETKSPGIIYFKVIEENGEEHSLQSYIEKISKNGK